VKFLQAVMLGTTKNRLDFGDDRVDLDGGILLCWCLHRTLLIFASWCHRSFAALCCRVTCSLWAQLL